MTLIDTNVLLDVVTRDPVWLGWSRQSLGAARRNGALGIAEVTYAELSVRSPTPDIIDLLLSDVNIEIVPTSRAALFLAGKAFQRYKLSGGAKLSVLPDFFIGAYAEALQLPLLTRDPRRFRRYFPAVALITP